MGVFERQDTPPHSNQDIDTNLEGYNKVPGDISPWSIAERKGN
jgi:hypothetical protein